MAVLSPEQLISSNPSGLSAGHLTAVRELKSLILNDPKLEAFRSSYSFQGANHSNFTVDNSMSDQFALVIAYRTVAAAVNVAPDHFGKADTVADRTSIGNFAVSALGNHHQNAWADMHPRTSKPSTAIVTIDTVRKEYAPTDPEVLRRACQKALGR